MRTIHKNKNYRLTTTRSACGHAKDSRFMGKRKYKKVKVGRLKLWGARRNCFYTLGLKLGPME